MGEPTSVALSHGRASRPHAVGFPKSGLRTALDEQGSTLALHGRADPILFYFVFGAALAVALGGGLVVSPRYGVTGVILFSVLFSPLLIFSSLGAIRLRSACRLDRSERRIVVNERAYIHSLQREWPLDALSGVVLRGRPPSRWASAGQTYSLFLEIGADRYLALEATSDPGLRRIAQRISRFVGVPMRVERSEHVPTHGRALDALVAAAIFLVPVILASVLLASTLRFLPAASYLLVVSMSALIVCQVGAILAYVFVRSRPAASG
jgi:hypothetical protein